MLRRGRGTVKDEPISLFVVTVAFLEFLDSIGFEGDLDEMKHVEYVMLSWPMEDVIQYRNQNWVAGSVNYSQVRI